jgi:hypothetical protein
MLSSLKLYTLIAFFTFASAQICYQILPDCRKDCNPGFECQLDQHCKSRCVKIIPKKLPKSKNCADGEVTCDTVRCAQGTQCIMSSDKDCPTAMCVGVD